MESDVLIGKVEPGRVWCKACRKWLSLSSDGYALSHWKTHRALRHPDGQESDTEESVGSLSPSESNDDDSSHAASESTIRRRKTNRADSIKSRAYIQLDTCYTLAQICAPCSSNTYFESDVIGKWTLMSSTPLNNRKTSLSAARRRRSTASVPNKNSCSDGHDDASHDTETTRTFEKPANSIIFNLSY